MVSQSNGYGVTVVAFADLVSWRPVYSGVTVVSQWCHSDVTMVLQQ
jgi:hypothetical protein